MLNILMLFLKKDRKLGPIVAKNLETRFNKNLKTSIMLTITVAFLILVGTSFK
jgi:hypothetical protein